MYFRIREHSSAVSEPTATAHGAPTGFAMRDKQHQSQPTGHPNPTPNQPGTQKWKRETRR